MDYKGTWWDRIVALEREILRGLAVVLVVLLLGWLAVNYFKPKEPTALPSTQSVSEQTKAPVSKDAAVIAELEAAYARQTYAGNDPAALAQWLDTEIERQNHLLRALPEIEIPTEQAKLSWLENKRQSLQAQAAGVRSRVVEREATIASQTGHSDAAQEALREALRLQRAANRQRASGGDVDFERESRLTQEVARSEAEPVEREIAALLKEAEAHPTEALKALRAAAERQRALNDKFAGTAYANQTRMKQIEALIATAESAPLAFEMESAELAAKAATTAGRPDTASEAYEQASRLQSQINEQFPLSSSASVERIAKFELQRQTVMVADSVARAMELDRSAGRMLRHGDVAAALEKIYAAAALLDMVMREFPLATADCGNLRTRLDFLWLLRGELARLRSQVMENLAPLARDGAVKMLKTEVAQALYVQVMYDNPSANIDLRLPVDSVTWYEARTFCQRLSWLLGMNVRLPSKEEFLLATAQSDWTRSQANAAGRSWEVGSMRKTGEIFQDVLGNVAEWLEAESLESPVAHIAGGSFLDPQSLPVSATITICDKNRRARHVGFRVVVE